MNRYSAGHQKLRLNVLLLPIVPFVVKAAIFPETTYQISLPALLVLFFLGLAFHLGLVVVHELGHVAAAALFRIPLRGFTIGHWRRLVSFKIRSVSVDIRAVPDVGYVVPGLKVSHIRVVSKSSRASLTRDYPDHLGFTECLGQACALSGDTLAAEKIFRQLLEKYADNKLKKAELLDWLICLALFCDRPDLLEEAKGWMAAALLYAPDAIALKGTKAAMEVTLGNYDAAIATIPELMKRAEMDADRAYLAAALAEAYAAKGQTAEAKRWLQIALAAEADNPGVKRAIKTLAAVPVG